MLLLKILKAEPEEKKLIISTMTKSVKFDGENLIVNLKATFKALQNVKKCILETSKNDDLRTRTTLTNTKKDPHSEGLFVNGALNGTISEPDNNVFNIFDTAECQAIFRRIEKLLAA